MISEIKNLQCKKDGITILLIGTRSFVPFLDNQHLFLKMNRIVEDINKFDINNDDIGFNDHICCDDMLIDKDYRNMGFGSLLIRERLINILKQNFLIKN